MEGRIVANNGGGWGSHGLSTTNMVKCRAITAMPPQSLWMIALGEYRQRRMGGRILFMLAEVETKGTEAAWEKAEAERMEEARLAAAKAARRAQSEKLEREAELELAKRRRQRQQKREDEARRLAKEERLKGERLAEEAARKKAKFEKRERERFERDRLLKEQKRK
jgi:hypothetical protein